jgi:hypothetical protein
VLMQHGRCAATLTSSDSTIAPFPVAGTATDEKFNTSYVDFTKASCTGGFKELPSSADWSTGVCITASTRVCLRDSGPQLIHIVAEFSGELSSALHIDDKPVAWSERTDWQDMGLFSDKNTVDTFVLLAGSCHKVSIVSDNGVATEKMTNEHSAHNFRKVRPSGHIQHSASSLTQAAVISRRAPRCHR